MSNEDFLEYSLGYNLKRVQHRLRRKMDDALKSCGLTAAQNAVLSSLKARPDQTNSDLATAAFITPQSMQAVLAGLEKAGHVERRSDEDHGRRQLARLTKSGERLAQQGQQATEQVEQLLTDAAGPCSKSDALALLRRLQHALD